MSDAIAQQIIFDSTQGINAEEMRLAQAALQAHLTDPDWGSNDRLNMIAYEDQT